MARVEVWPAIGSRTQCYLVIVGPMMFYFSQSRCIGFREYSEKRITLCDPGRHAARVRHVQALEDLHDFHKEDRLPPAEFKRRLAHAKDRIAVAPF